MQGTNKYFLINILKLGIQFHKCKLPHRLDLIICTHTRRYLWVTCKFAGMDTSFLNSKIMRRTYGYPLSGEYFGQPRVSTGII